MPGHRHRLLTLGVLAGSAALLGAGFPAKDVPGKEVSAEKWVKAVCTSLRDWADDLTAAQEDVDQSDADLDRKKQDLVAYLRTVTKATDRLITKLEKAGTPNVPDGSGIASAFEEGFLKARKAFADGRRRAKKLDTDDPAEFEDSLSDIQARIREGAVEVGETFDEADEEFDVPELDEAFNNEPSCSGVA